MLDAKDDMPAARVGEGLLRAVEVVDAGRLDPGVAAWIEGKTREAMAVLEASGEVRVRVVGDEEMAAAHLRWKGVPGTTDVLTFDLGASPDPERPDTPEGASALDADVLVCADEATRQAKARGHRAEHELLLYIVHAMLHCLGHDDLDETAAARMHAEEDRVLQAVGVGVTYARGEGGL